MYDYAVRKYVALIRTTILESGIATKTEGGSQQHSTWVCNPIPFLAGGGRHCGRAQGFNLARSIRVGQGHRGDLAGTAWNHQNRMPHTRCCHTNSGMHTTWPMAAQYQRCHEETFGVDASASAGVVMAAPGAAGGGEAAEAP